MRRIGESMPAMRAAVRGRTSKRVEVQVLEQVRGCRSRCAPFTSSMCLKRAWALSARLPL
jgi:hypothetical protein